MDHFVWSRSRRIIPSSSTPALPPRSRPARKRRFLRCPIEALSLVGVDGNAVKDVVLTHMLYDHFGNFPRLANAQFHPQEVELHCTTGRHMRHPFLARSFEVEDVIGIVRLNFQNMETGRPFTAAFNIADMLEAYDALRAPHAPTHITSTPVTTRWSCGNTRRRGTGARRRSGPPRRSAKG